jgi:predicted ATP-grasp superfamily ATP-dependent carboligase
LNWRARISVKRLIIAAVSARPFVRAAKVAGFEVIAADVFCDVDTRRDVVQAVQLGYRQGGFDAEDVRRKLIPLLAPDAGFVYGSGFETQAHLLEEIAQHCAVVGNAAETVRMTKDPDRFFSCLESLDLPFPETVRQLPAGIDGWLCKRIGGSGGMHVSSPILSDHHYFQRIVPGRPCSLLFLADGGCAVAIGYNEQWLAPIPDMPWRYGGAVSRTDLPQDVKAGMLEAAQQLTAEIGLRGLNSLDCMVDGDRWWILEVNPRLSATFALYDAANSGASLLDAHLQAGAGRFGGVGFPEFSAGDARAHLIYYAPFDVKVPPDMLWPDWAVDIPVPESRVMAGQPLCTVLAEAADADKAASLVRQRAGQLLQHIHQWQEE